MLLAEVGMIEQFVSVLFWLIIVIPIGVFARQIRQVRRGGRREYRKVIVSFFSYSILPVLIYALVFLVLVGVEELTRLALIPEGFSRTLLLVIGIGSAEVLILTVIFAIAVWFLRVPGDAA